MHFLVIILLLIFNICDSSKLELRQRRQSPQPLTKLGADVVKKIDTETRKQILFLIADHLNDTVHAQSVRIASCEKKINDTIQQCSDCPSCPEQSRPKASSLELIFRDVSSNINTPITYAGTVVREIAGWTVEAKSFLGDRWGEFTKTIGGNFKDIGSVLSHGGKHLFSSAVSAFQSLGDKLESVGQNIIDTGFVDKVKDVAATIKQPFSDFDETIKNIGQTLSDRASTVKDTITNVATSVWKNTFGRLLRKRRNVQLCSDKCPSCAKLNVPLTKRDELTDSVCGVGTSKQKKGVVNEIKFLRDLYNKTASGEQITSIEYDKSSEWIDEGGNLVYSESYFTWNGKRMQLIAGDLDLNSPFITGEEIAHQYFATEISSHMNTV